MEYVTRLLPDKPEVATTSKYPGLRYEHPVKYYDFHVYYYDRIPSSKSESDNLRAKLLEDFPDDTADGSIIVKILPDDRVIGPHITQFWEADVARPEVFVRLLSWFQLHHGGLSVLIHPQTGADLLDHTNRALWLGDRLPVITEIFPPPVEGSEGIPEFGVRRGQKIPADKFDQHVSVPHKD